MFQYLSKQNCYTGSYAMKLLSEIDDNMHEQNSRPVRCPAPIQTPDNNGLPVIVVFYVVMLALIQTLLMRHRNSY